MNTPAIAQLPTIGVDRRAKIAEAWYRAVVDTSFSHLTRTELRQHFVVLARQAVDALLAEPFERDRARAVGVELARLHFIQPEALGRTQEVLARELVAELSAGQVTAVYPHLTMLLGELAAGFFEQARRVILDEQDEIRGALFIARREADVALKASEMQFHSAFDNAPIGMALIHPDGRWLQVNHALCDIVGYSEEELRHSTIQAMTYPDDAATDSTHARRLLMDEVTSYQIEKRFVHKHGQIVWVLLSATLVRDVYGEPRYLIAQIQDITERKRAAEAIERERRQLRIVIDSAPVAMAMFDRDMRYLAYSARWIADFELPGGWLVGQAAFEAHPDLLKPVSASLQLALSGRPVSKPEDIWQRDDQSVVHIRWAMTPWYTTEDEIGGVVIATHRIDELVQAREAALETSRLKSKFLASVSHEIRTPMNAILGTTELLFTTSLTAEQTELATILQNSAHGLLSIIDDILDFSKAEAGKLSLAIDDFVLVELVESTADLFLAGARKRETNLMTFVAPEVPSALRGDAGRLRQILVNLIGNAVKFTESGDVVVRVTIAAATPEHVTVRFAVQDSGIGLSDTALTSLFQPFVQADGSTTRKYGGTGLGLAISKQLVELMGGAIGVDSVEGHGSTFWFTVPFERSCTAPAPLAPGSSSMHGLRALVVETSPVEREILRRYLEIYGMRVDEAATLDEAWTGLRAASTDSYSMLFLSTTLPGIEPLSIARAIHEEPDLEQVRLILVASFDEPRRDDEALRLAFAGYLPRPLKQSSVRDVVVAALQTALPAKPIPEDKIVAGGAGSLPSTSEQIILVVDDNLINQKLARMQLQHLGYQVELAGNGREALDLLATRSYALVLMDCQMPEMDGYDATRVIRQVEQSTGQHIPIIAMTAYAMPDQREQSLAVGMDDHLSKPVTARLLKEMLSRFLPVEPSP